MSVHYGGLKIGFWVASLAAAAVFAMDPTVKVALIAAIPASLLGVGTLILGFLNRKAQQETHDKVIDLKVNVDGRLSQLLAKTEIAAHAEGHREGVEQAGEEAKQTAAEIKQALVDSNVEVREHRQQEKVDNAEIQAKLGKILSDKDQQLADTQDKLSHAEGRREGVEAAQEKTKGETK